MRIAMVAYAFYDGNARIQQYATALAQRGDVVDLILLSRSGSRQPPFETINGVNLYRIQSRPLGSESLIAYAWRVFLFLLRCSFLLTKKHLVDRYQVIHVHSVPDFLVFAAIIPRILGAAVILDIHDILPEFYASKCDGGKGSKLFEFLVFVEKVSIRFSDHVIIANHVWYERLLNRSVKADKLTTINNYPNPDIFFPRERERFDRKFVITYPGTLSWHQGVDIALRAFARVSSEIPEAEFHIYGNGAERDNLVQLANDLGLRGRVKFQDFLSIEAIAKVMANSDLAVVAKRAGSTFGNEAASTKIMEFMAVGVPVIVSRTKVDTFYHSESTVKFFTSEDVDDLAKSIAMLYRDASLRNKLSSNAIAYTREHSWNQKKNEYFAIVDSLASRRSKNVYTVNEIENAAPK
jgi:glycosyltransferase involved in cell wall biosynthesis